jgi:hypothetical protein
MVLPLAVEGISESNKKMIAGEAGAVKCRGIVGNSEKKIDK